MTKIFKFAKANTIFTLQSMLLHGKKSFQIFYCKITNRNYPNMQEEEIHFVFIISNKKKSPCNFDISFLYTS